MKSISSLICVLYSCFLSLNVNAQEVRVTESSIESVTVFSDRAEITRVAELELSPGLQTLQFKNLPDRTDPNSIRVDGHGKFVLHDIKAITQFYKDIPDAKRKALFKQKETLEEQILKLKNKQKRISKQSQLLESIMDKFTSVSEDAPPPDMDVTKWDQIMEFHDDKLADFDSQNAQQKETLKSLNLSLQKIQKEINKLKYGQEKEKKAVEISIDVKKSGTISLQLSYIVYGPRWYPSYDIRVNSVSKKLQLSYYGNITQNTGEDWKHTDLKLSTAKAMVSGREPELQPWRVKERVYKPRRTSKPSLSVAPATSSLSGKASTRNMFAPAKFDDAVAELKEMETLTSTADLSATAAVYSIKSKSTIISNNEATQVTILISSFPASFRYSAVPKLTPYTYLKARFLNDTDFTLLPGKSNIFLDNSFVASSSIDLVSPNESEWIYLGIDEGIKVERKMIHKKDGQGGFISKSREHVFEYLFEISNNKPSEIELVLWDQLPILEHKEITLKLITPKNFKNNTDVKINEYRFVEWIRKIDSGEKLKIPFKFSIRHPADMDIIGL